MTTVPEGNYYQLDIRIFTGRSGAQRSGPMSGLKSGGPGSAGLQGQVQSQLV